MSNLPEINSMKVIQKFSSKVTELTYQVFQYEVLCETLRDQRDGFEAERDAALQRNKELTEQLAQYMNPNEDTVEGTIVEN